MDEDFSNIKFNPQNRNFLFAQNEFKCYLIEIKDAFPDTYTSNSLLEINDLNVKKEEEENLMFKRYEKLVLEKEDTETFEDFSWDIYNNIYVAISTGYVNLYDTSLNMISIQVQGKPKDNIEVPGKPLCLLLSQRYLLCALDTGKLALINIFANKKELTAFSKSFGSPEEYKMFHVAKQISLFNENQNIKFMKFDSNYSKLIVGTDKCIFYNILLKGELLIREDEKNELKDSGNGNYQDLETFEECKFHDQKIIGVKELGQTSQYLTAGKDNKIIIWELTDRNAKYVNELEYEIVSFEVDNNGDLLIIGDSKGILRIYDISNRNILRLIYQMSFIENGDISGIIVSKDNSLICFYNNETNVLYFLSGDLSKNFIFLGFLKIPVTILDITIHNKTNSIIVLTEQILLMYEINNFYFDHKHLLEVKQKKIFNIFENFELKPEMIKGRRVDSDLNFIIKNIENDKIWLTGSDKFLRLYDLPSENFEFIRENKMSPKNPLEEIKGHDLNITYGILLEEGNIILTGSSDGVIQIRQNKHLIKQIKLYSYLKDGISSAYYSEKFNLLYVIGYDSSLFILNTMKENNKLPLEPINSLEQNSLLLNMDNVELDFNKEACNFNKNIKEEHLKIVNFYKKSNQAMMKSKIDEIKLELLKYQNENQRLEEIEQLKVEEMIIDLDKVEKYKLKGEKAANETIKSNFHDLCKLELTKNKLLEFTYNKMIVKEENLATVNNNMRLISSSNGDKVLKSYPLINKSEIELKKLNHVKQLRLIEINNKQKLKNDKQIDILNEDRFSYGLEEYIINRGPGKFTLMETEIKQSEIIDTQTGEISNNDQDDKRQFKLAKYKLQREPYENENSKNLKLDNDNNDQVDYMPDEQLLKEDINIRFRTVTVNNFIFKNY